MGLGFGLGLLLKRRGPAPRKEVRQGCVVEHSMLRFKLCPSLRLFCLVYTNNKIQRIQSVVNREQFVYVVRCDNETKELLGLSHHVYSQNPLVDFFFPFPLLSAKGFFEWIFGSRNFLPLLPATRSWGRGVGGSYEMSRIMRSCGFRVRVRVIRDE